MSLSPDDDLMEKEIESWRGFWETLREDDRKLFKEMLQEARKHSRAMAVKSEPFPVEPLLMSILLEQYKKTKKTKNMDDMHTQGEQRD